MQALLKSAALAAVLGLGAAGAASAATLKFTGGNIYSGTYDLTDGATYTVTVTGSATAYYTLYTSDLSYAASGSFGSSFDYAYSDPDISVGYLVAVVGDGKITIVSSDDNTPVVPLPASLPLLAGALGVAGVVARRRKAA